MKNPFESWKRQSGKEEETETFEEPGEMTSYREEDGPRHASPEDELIAREEREANPETDL